MRIYMGFRMEGDCCVYVWDAHRPAKPVRLDPRLDLRNHSPSGFEWGFAGSGPTQLTLALAADALGDGRRAVSIYQTLKRHLLPLMASDCWSLTADRVCELVLVAEKERGVYAPSEAEFNGMKESEES